MVQVLAHLRFVEMSVGIIVGSDVRRIKTVGVLNIIYVPTAVYVSYIATGLLVAILTMMIAF
jgi:hypothetical protein